MDKNIFKHLNKEQKEAASYVKGSSIIMAGAGSGKTRVLVHKVLNLIKNHQVDEDSIVMITFTNKAANEMKQRIIASLNRKESRILGYIGTFHSFCAAILRREIHHLGWSNNFVIYDEDDQLSLIKSILKKKGIDKHTPSYFLNRISAAKNQMISHDRYLSLFSDYNAAQVAEIYHIYEGELKKNNALDFDDLIMKTVALFIKNERVLRKYQEQFRYLLVDEFQDTNYAQYALTRILGECYRNVTVVGDFSQSIYSWRGADIRNLEKFKEDFSEAKTFCLEENYRSTQKILDFAYDVISKNQTHPILNLYTANDKGEDVIFYDAENEEGEALYIAQEIEGNRRLYSYPSFAVLYRTNAQSRAIEEAFLHLGTPYLLIGGVRFYERKEIKDVLSYLRLLVNPNDQVSKDRVIKLGKRRWQSFADYYSKAKDETADKNTADLIEEVFAATSYLGLYNPEDEEDYSRMENIKELKSVAYSFPKLTEFLEQVALVESEYFEGEKRNKGREGVKLMTIHQAKGLEFPIVFVVGVEEGILPHARSIDDYFQLEEERRLFYVAITRAKEKLYITNAKRRFIFGHRGETMKSRFIGGGNSMELNY
jgi:DNA helicase-2/ATP-dependent DNA helicase PcrA